MTPSGLVGKWDDEDVERPTEIKDSWEDEDEEKEERPKADSQKHFAQTSKKKQSGKQKQKKDELKAAEEAAAQPARPLTYEEKKALQDKVEKSDFAHAVDLFEGVDPDNESLFGEASSSVKLAQDEFQPTTAADFKKYGTMLANKVIPFKVHLLVLFWLALQLILFHRKTLVTMNA